MGASLITRLRKGRAAAAIARLPLVFFSERAGISRLRFVIARVQQATRSSSARSLRLNVVSHLALIIIIVVVLVVWMADEVHWVYAKEKCQGEVSFMAPVWPDAGRRCEHIFSAAFSGP